MANILSGRYYGFAVCDVTSPPEFIEKFEDLNFPPIIRKSKIDPDWLSPFMKEQLSSNRESLPDDETLIQCYNGKQILLSTEFMLLYKRIGLEISNITQFYQFKPAYPLTPFTDAVTRGRKRATRDGNDTLGLAYKLVGNSG